MNYKYFLIGAAMSAGLIAGSTSLASAAVLTVRQVMTECPDLDQAKACPPMATRFLGGQPNDGQIVNLVIALAEAGQTPKVPLPVCLNVADGLRVLAGGLSNAGQAQQVRDIADALCDDTATAAIGEGRGRVADSGPPPSLVGDGGRSGPPAPPAAVIPEEDPPVDDPPVDDPPVDDPPVDDPPVDDPPVDDPPVDDPPVDDPPVDDPPVDDPPVDDPPVDDPPVDDPPVDDPPVDEEEDCAGNSGETPGNNCNENENSQNPPQPTNPCEGLTGREYGQCMANQG